MADKIDDSKAVTMGQFKEAIEDFVKGYISDKLNGVHGVVEVAEEAQSGLKQDQFIPVSINLPSNIGKHWGIINVTTNNNGDYLSDTATPQTQIIIW